MKLKARTHRIAAFAAVLTLAACGSRPRTVTVAQSGPADVIGSDSAALRRAAALVRPGGTLAIGPGTYEMHDSLVIPSGVTVRGTAGQTILRKSRGVESALIEDGDYGDTFLRVAEPGKFRPGMGVSILDDKQSSGWDISVSSVVAVEGDTLRLDPMTVRDYDQQRANARVRNTFPILCAMNAGNVVFENITVDGNKDENAYIDGCRGGAIYLYHVRDVVVRNCIARNYNGDGISFQITDGVQVLNCESHGHTGYGIHPGTGSARATVRNCRLHDNGQVGLFLCWRVRHGRFVDNTIEGNGRYGVSIGHKDTDNEFAGNTIARNGFAGVYFRKESFSNSGHRNVFRGNKVLDNGGGVGGYGFYILPEAGETVIEENQIAESRSANATQRFGIYRVTGAGAVHIKANRMSGHAESDYREGPAR